MNHQARKENLKKNIPAPDRLASVIRRDSGSQTPEFLSNLLDTLDIGVAVVNVEGRIRYANASFLQTLWIHSFRSNLVSNLSSLVSPADWCDLRDALRRGTAEPTYGQLRIVDADLSQRTIALCFSPISDGTANLVCITTREVTAIEATAEALKQSEASRLNLNVQLLRVQDEERRRIARDLHDVIGQELAVTTMSLGFASRHAKDCDTAVRSRIEEALNSLRSLDSQIRTLSYLLHPPMLDENGLPFALRWFANGFSKRTGIHVVVSVAEDLPRMTPDKEAALFRIIQESLTNVFRHSGARNAWVTVSLKDRSAHVLVEDDGCGFGPHATPARQGLGMQSMRGRLEPHGGVLTVQRLGDRTQVIAVMPLTWEEQPAALAESQPIRPLAVLERTPVPSPQVTARKMRVLIADDHEVVRKGIKFLLDSDPEFEICGEAEDGLQAVRKTDELRPDLLILDVAMPHLSGFSVATQIRRAGLDTRILIFTNHAYSELNKVAQASGCNGLVVKSNASGDLIRAAKLVLQGGEFYQHHPTAQEKSANA